MELFNTDYGVNNSEPDNTEITTHILYYSKEELKLFKKLCKAGMRLEFGEQVQEKGNISDLLLKVLKEKYENI